jgi:hypothetical protein
MYLLLAVGGSVLWVARFAAVSAGSYGPAARIMLVVIALGATVLWPMVRLSQASPRGSVVSHVLADVFIILAPTQCVLWPLIVLSNWPMSVVGGIAAMIGTWVFLSGGLLALGLSGSPADRIGHPRLLGRTLWMGVIIAAVGAGPVLSLLYGMGRRKAPEWLALLSPLTGIPSLTGAGLSGPQAPVSGQQWWWIGGVAGVSVAVWAIAGIRSALGDGRRPA